MTNSALPFLLTKRQTPTLLLALLALSLLTLLIKAAIPTNSGFKRNSSSIASEGMFPQSQHRAGAGGIASLSDLTVLYVNEQLATGDNDGSSWENAFRGKGGLSEALHYARTNSVDEIWVAKGTYVPTRRADNHSNANPNDRHNAFVLVEGVKIYGGFAGAETALSKRNPGLNPTILSGDIGAPINDYDNCYHVVISIENTAETRLDGVIITLGMAADFLPPADNNAILQIGEYSVPVAYGGAMYNIHSSPTLRNIVIDKNTAFKDGAGILNDHSSPDIANAVFARNLTEEIAGAMANKNSSLPKLSHVTLTRNTGSAILNDSQSGVVITNSILWNNYSAPSGYPNDIYDRDASGTSVKNSITEQYGTEGVDGIIHQNPLFETSFTLNTALTWMTDDDALSLTSGSPGIDAADNLLTPEDLTNDITGAPRRIGARADMGAYE